MYNLFLRISRWRHLWQKYSSFHQIFKRGLEDKSKTKYILMSIIASHQHAHQHAIAQETWGISSSVPILSACDHASHHRQTLDGTLTAIRRITKVNEYK